MAAGFGNTGAVTFATSFAFLTGTTAQQITGPGWTAATGDVTPIAAADVLLRTKVVSGRLDQQPITVPFFMDAATITAPTLTTSQTLSITYPDQATTPFAMPAGMTGFKYGDLIDDEIMIGECEFMLIGGAALDDFAA